MILMLLNQQSDKLHDKLRYKCCRIVGTMFNYDYIIRNIYFMLYLIQIPIVDQRLCVSQTLHFKKSAVRVIHLTMNNSNVKLLDIQSEGRS